MSAISPTTSSKDPTGGTVKVALENVKDGADDSKGIWDKVKDFAATIGGKIKNFLFASVNFLKNSGVRIGTSLGIAVAVLAVVGCVVSLPFSLPLLGAIAGGIFAAGVIGKLIKNIRDPEVQGVANVIKQTLKEIKSDIVMGAERMMEYITSPTKIYTDISEGILNNEKSVRGFRENRVALDDIIKYSKAALGGLFEPIEALYKNIEVFETKIRGSGKPGNQSTDPLETARQDILKTLRDIQSRKEEFKDIAVHSNLLPLESILQNLIEKFEDKDFIATLRAEPKIS